MGGPYKLKKRGKPMTTIYDAAILLVDDNPDLLTLVTDNLRTAGYKSVCTAADCAAARAAFAAHRPDLMILDINLPDGDGFGLFRTLRTESDVPALFLSARDADADRLFGLGLGADDYLTKPFLMQELLLRVQHLLQRAYRTELRRSRVLTLGDCTVNLQDAAVRRADGTTLALTATERALLQRLADDRGHIVTYDAVCEAVWGADYYGYENSLNVHIRHLREKIEPDPGHPLLGAVVYLGLHYGEATDSRVRIGTLAEALTPTADGLQLDPARTPADWLQGYAWAMALDDDGNVIWQHDLPQNLNKHYTASEIASFSRWYLDDWPVFCWTADYGLFVAAVPRGSVWKYNIYNNEQLMNAMAAGMLPALALLLGVAAACCLLFSWRGARRLQTIAAGLATVADGGTIRLSTDGFAGELADTVNRTSEQLRRRNEIIARRDDARTSWIAGVSHDVRTPLALILGWAEQLEQDTALPAAARQKACGIRTQSEKLRALIEDLNLTSKLQYGAQPLRCRPTQAGPLLRRLAAEFCDSPLAASCTVALEIAPDADKAILDADAALLARAVENLLHNAACHNPGPVQVQLSAVRTGKTLRITIADDGAGYPPAVLHALQTGEAGENTPHILGLHVVEQIIRAHGGTAAFARNVPRGAKAVLVLPVTEDPAAR